MPKISTDSRIIQFKIYADKSKVRRDQEFKVERNISNSGDLDHPNKRE